MMDSKLSSPAAAGWVLLLLPVADHRHVLELVPLRENVLLFVRNTDRSAHCRSSPRVAVAREGLRHCVRDPTPRIEL
jgi:hypothetical protein